MLAQVLDIKTNKQITDQLVNAIITSIVRGLHNIVWENEIYENIVKTNILMYMFY